MPACSKCRDLHEAKQKIDAAIKLFTETKWPRTDADYEALERAHNRR